VPPGRQAFLTGEGTRDNLPRPSGRSGEAGFEGAGRMADTGSPVAGRARVPAGLVGAVALAAALEAGVFDRGEGPGSFIPASWHASGRLAGRDAAGVCAAGGVLLLGDSQVKCGLIPTEISRRLGRPALNLAVVGGQAPA